jgi:hypothetical protein
LQRQQAELHERDPVRRRAVALVAAAESLRGRLMAADFFRSATERNDGPENTLDRANFRYLAAGCLGIVRQRPACPSPR